MAKDSTTVVTNHGGKRVLHPEYVTARHGTNPGVNFDLFPGNVPPIDCAIFLCDLTGVAAQPWAEAGIECYCVDVQHSIRRDRREGNINFVWGDVRSWRPPAGRRIVFVASMSPCTHVAGSGARDFEKKGGMLLRDALELFEAGRQCAAWSGAPYYCENPVGVLSSMPHIGKADHYFHPYEYAGYCADDWYTKKTCLWIGNGFQMPEPNFDRERFARGEVAWKHFKKTGEKLPDYADYPDNRIHFASPDDDRGNVRSASPLGFNRAVFLANAPAEYLRRIAA